MKGSRLAVLLVLLTVPIGFGPSAVRAQPGASENDIGYHDVVGWYVVESGDTLQSITARFLGTESLWYANWRLNPQVLDPSRIYPGQRLRIIQERQVPARKALLEDVANNVDKNPRRAGWQEAARGDQLEAPSGIRTGLASSALVNFDDDARFTLTEHTQVFIKNLQTDVTGRRRGEIAVERGQADLVIAPIRNARRRGEIEVVVGDAIARPSTVDSTEARLRTSDGGDASLMVYGGSSDIAAGGRSVAVPAGMGTSVPSGGAPRPPERLVRAPRFESPAAGARLDYRNPRIRWRAVPGAAHYVVEVCADTDCTQLITRADGVADLTWRPDRLDDGLSYIRVTAVAASGLDGYPNTLAVTVDAASDPIFDRVDLEAPVIAIQVVGAGTAATAGRIVLGPGGRLRPTAHDDVAGVEALRYRWNGGEWRTHRGGDLGLPPGRDAQIPEVYALELEARDRADRVSEPLQLEVTNGGPTVTPPAVRIDR